MAEAGWKIVKPILLQALGYMFLVLGVLGMFLPVLQGFLFLFIGLIILAKHAPWAERLLHNIRSRHPKLDHVIGESEAKAHRWGERSKALLRRSWQTATAWLRPWEPSPRPTKKRCSCRPDP